jgi:hypothetical protein
MAGDKLQVQIATDAPQENAVVASLEWIQIKDRETPFVLYG